MTSPLPMIQHVAKRLVYAEDHLSSPARIKREAVTRAPEKKVPAKKRSEVVAKSRRNEFHLILTVN